MKKVTFNMTFKPFVYWAQTDGDIFLKVDVRNVVGEPDICIEEEEIEFSATGVGSQADGLHQNYHFVIEFFLPIDPVHSQVDVAEKEVRIHLKKKEADWWPRLLYEQKKLAWLRIDFDKWKTDDSASEDYWPNWAMWLHTAGEPGVDANKGTRFSDIGMALQVAAQGGGVALGSRVLAADDLAAGRLIRPFELSMEVAFAYYMVSPEAIADEPRVVAFREWVLAEAHADQPMT